jgi:glycosyltransferase involved in cell wall biosynthesis
MHDQLTFVVFTFNEEKRLPLVLKNFCNFARILIVDNSSTDRTIEIAKEYGCDVLVNKNQGWVEDEITASRVKARVQTDWIYWGYADEMVDASLMNIIGNVIASDNYSVINVEKKNYFLGRFCHGIWAARLNRVFKKDAIDFSGNKIHYFGRVTVPDERIYVVNSKYFVHHFISHTAGKYSNTMNVYSDLEVQVGFNTKPIGMGIILLKAIKRFVVNYAYCGGFKAGIPGLYLILLTIWYDILRDMKLYEAQKRLDVIAIEETNDVVRREILTKVRSPY